MQNLSHVFSEFGSDPITALAPTSQEAGNQQHNNSLAMTAAGTEPAVPVTTPSPGGHVVHDPPEIGSENYRYSPVVIEADGSRKHGDVSGDDGRPSLFGQPGGDVWKSSRESGNPEVPDVTRRNMIRRGEWNQL